MWVISVGNSSSRYLAPEADVMPSCHALYSGWVLHHPKERDDIDEDTHVLYLDTVKSLAVMSAYSSWHLALQ